MGNIPFTYLRWRKSSMQIDEIIEKALEEDLGDGDHTSLSTIPSTAMGKAVLVAKEEGVIAGIEVAKKVFQKVDASINFIAYVQDGDLVKVGDEVFEVSGPSISLLSAERLALNFMQRMSGVASATNQMMQQLEGLSTRLLDTRKTTPLMRALEKQAVLAGGGENHRFGLYDMIMIKDNHVDFAGGIEAAIEACNSYLKEKNKDLKIEIEVRNFAELEQVLSFGSVHRIMLDNFTPEDLLDAVKRIDGRFETEASGNIKLSTVRTYAETGVDFISSGALTHQIKSLDLSLKAR